MQYEGGASKAGNLTIPGDHVVQPASQGADMNDNIEMSSELTINLDDED